MPYIGNTDDDRQQMLKTIGVQSLEDLFADIPSEFRFPDLTLPRALSEQEILREIEELGNRNASGRGHLSFQGAGAYNHFIPAVVSYLAGRGEFATAYTPYQAEASQGTVQSIYEYQSMVSDLLGMEVVNASHYDGATAVAEAALMSVRAVRGRDRVVLSGTLHPEYLDVTRTYLRPQGIGVSVIGVPSAPGTNAPTPSELLEAVDDRTACLIVQNPDFLGSVSDLSSLSEEVHARGALLVIHTDPVAAALFQSPGSQGADIVTGEGQPLGIPLSFGGPYLGLFAAKKELVRKMPGRLAGETVDSEGRRGFVLTLNTREQHIRREKAVSNICTNQGLMALRAAIHLAAMGPSGMREAAELCYHKAHYAAHQIEAIEGFEVSPQAPRSFFKEFVVSSPLPAADLVSRCQSRGVIPGVPLSRYFPGRQNELLVAVTETAAKADIDQLVSVMSTIVREAQTMASEEVKR